VTTSPATALPLAPPSPARELWRDFRKNRGAVIGLVVLGLLVFCALFADVISPYDPSEQFRDATLRAPSLTSAGGHVFSSAPTRSAATSSRA
jgi:ABC-type antimicrobial peptide transport system, permease component